LKNTLDQKSTAPSFVGLQQGWVFANRNLTYGSIQQKW